MLGVSAEATGKSSQAATRDFLPASSPARVRLYITHKTPSKPERQQQQTASPSYPFSTA